MKESLAESHQIEKNAIKKELKINSYGKHTLA